MITIEVIQMLYLRFCDIFGEKFKNGRSLEETNRWYQEWHEGLIDINPKNLKDAISYCRNELEWSPSIAKFRKICQQIEGIPSPEECMQAAIRRDFYHPLIQKIFDKVTSWNMGRDSESDLLKKFKTYHEEILTEQTRLAQLEFRKPLKEVGDQSNGSEISRDNTRGTCVRKAEGYLF
jgi:hypothetical protein